MSDTDFMRPLYLSIRASLLPPPEQGNVSGDMSRRPFQPPTWLPPDAPPDQPPDPWTPPPYQDPQEYWSPLLEKVHLWASATSTHGDLDAYLVDPSVADPIVPDLMEFWANARDFIQNKWGQMDAWFQSINAHLETFWNTNAQGMHDFGVELVKEITGVANYIGNMVTWFTWNLVDDIRNFAASLFYPLSVWMYQLQVDITTWLESIWEALVNIFMTPVEWIQNIFSDIATWLQRIGDAIWDVVITAATVVGDYIYTYIDPIRTMLSSWLESIWQAIVNLFDVPIEWVKDLFDTISLYLSEIKDSIGAAIHRAVIDLNDYAALAALEFTAFMIKGLKDALVWFWEHLKEDLTLVWEQMVLPVYDAASGSLGWLKDQFTNLVGLAWDEIYGKAKSVAPITPEKSAGVAVAMFGSAVGFGTLAHTMALAVEAVPSLKYLGVHYLSAFAARMGSFGTISSATVGVIAALSIKVPFTYYMNSILRPTIPKDSQLIEFRAKREFNFDSFSSYMKYHGYTEEWIKLFDSWLWKDPRLFEILYCADVTVPPVEWLQRKFERAGYEDIDISTLIKVVERRTTRSPRTYYTTSMRRNFRHGFMTEDEVVEGIHALEMAEEAVDWIKRAGELDNIYEVNSDLVTGLKLAYRNDLISGDEFTADLAGMGLPRDRIDAIEYLEWVRKEPRLLREEEKAFEAEWREIQKDYAQVYIESFRRGLINEESLSAYLTSIGYHEKVAKMTARHEAIKQLPKSKPDPITIPAIPAPAMPPVYDQ